MGVPLSRPQQAHLKELPSKEIKEEGFNCSSQRPSPACCASRHPQRRSKSQGPRGSWRTIECSGRCGRVDAMEVLDVNGFRRNKIAIKYPDGISSLSALSPDLLFVPTSLTFRSRMLRLFAPAQASAEARTLRTPRPPDTSVNADVAFFCSLALGNEGMNLGIPSMEATRDGL